MTDISHLPAVNERPCQCGSSGQSKTDYHGVLHAPSSTSRTCKTVYTNCGRASLASEASWLPILRRPTAGFPYRWYHQSPKLPALDSLSSRVGRRSSDPRPPLADPDELLACPAKWIVCARARHNHATVCALVTDQTSVKVIAPMRKLGISLPRSESGTAPGCPLRRSSLLGAALVRSVRLAIQPTKIVATRPKVDSVTSGLDDRWTTTIPAAIAGWGMPSAFCADSSAAS